MRPEDRDSIIGSQASTTDLDSVQEDQNSNGGLEREREVAYDSESDAGTGGDRRFQHGGLNCPSDPVGLKRSLLAETQGSKGKLLISIQKIKVGARIRKLTKVQHEINSVLEEMEARWNEMRSQLESGEFKDKVDVRNARNEVWIQKSTRFGWIEMGEKIVGRNEELGSEIDKKVEELCKSDPVFVGLSKKLDELRLNARSPGFFSEGVNYRGGKIFGSVLIGVTLVSFIVWGIATGWFDRVAHPNQPQTPVIAEVIKHESSTKTMLQEACVEMQSAAVRFEGNAREMYPGGKYENMLTALEPVWIVAYEEASRYINGNLSALPIVGWGASAPLPVLPYVSDHASVADSAKIAKQVEQDLDQHALNEFARPFYLHQQFSQQHIEAIDEAAFQSIVNAAGLSFSTHSDPFYKAYTGMYSVLDISRECYPYIHEDKATRARYKQLRAIQTVRDANTEAILDGIFDARSALPATKPLPAIQATA